MDLKPTDSAPTVPRLRNLHSWSPALTVADRARDSQRQVYEGEGSLAIATRRPSSALTRNGSRS